MYHSSRTASHVEMRIPDLKPTLNALSLCEASHAHHPFIVCLAVLLSACTEKISIGLAGYST